MMPASGVGLLPGGLWGRGSCFARGPYMPRIGGKKPPGSSMPRFSPEQGTGRKPGQYREQRRALKMLADAPRGVSEEILVVVHGFSAEMLAGLELAGLATVVAETKSAPRGATIKVERIRVTDARRTAL